MHYQGKDFKAYSICITYSIFYRLVFKQTGGWNVSSDMRNKLIWCDIN